MEEAIKYLAEFILIASVICSGILFMYKIYMHQEGTRKKYEELWEKALTKYIGS